jgi:exodeoxyribonuclease VII small subunit
VAETSDTPANLSFEEAMKELETIVRKLEGGQGDLEASIADYLRGTALRNHCQQKLHDAKLKVDQIMKTPDGSLALQPFETQKN